MPTFHRDTLLPLARNHAWPSLSLYLPTHRTNSEKEQDRIRFKNLIRTACDQLSSGEMRHADAEHTCAPLHDLLNDPSFWRDTADGLAVFVSPDLVQTMKLDAPVPEIAIVGDRFYLRPLIAAAGRDHSFFALALSRGGSRLFKGDGAGMEEVDLEGVPTSLADELKFDETQYSIQYTSVPAPGSSAGAVFHGHGGEKDTDKINLERYLRKVEGAVSAAVAGEPNVPLILFGVEYEIAMYRGLNSAPSLVTQQVTGATDELKPHEIHAHALSALAPFFAATGEKWLAELTDHEGSSLATHDAKRIAEAAAEGRVKAIFFDDDIHPVNGNGWDLVDLAAVETALHGGEVHAFAGEDAPLRGVAALLRY